MRLQSTESQLYWRRTVRVRSGDAHSEAECLHVRGRLPARLVAGAVAKNHRVVSPVAILCSQLLGERRQKEAEDVAVGVHLGEGTVKHPIRVDRHQHRHPWI